MIPTTILLAWFGSTTPDVAVVPSDVVFMAPITGVSSPGCALMLQGRENEVNISGTCDEVKIKLGLGVK